MFGMSNGFKLAKKPYAQARHFAERMAGILEGVGVPRNCVHFCGSLRRLKPEVGDVDILIVSESGCDASIYTRFLAALATEPEHVEVKTNGAKWCSVQVGDFLLEMKQTTPHAFGAALLFMTGSGDFNMQMRKFAKMTGFKLSQYGLFNRATDEIIAATTEQAIFAALGIDYIEPADRSEFSARIGREIEPAIAEPVAFVPDNGFQPLEEIKQRKEPRIERVPSEASTDEPVIDPIAAGLAFEICFA